MKKLINVFSLIALLLMSTPLSAQGAGGIYASGGGTKTAGENFTVSVVARGVQFDSLQGRISVSGPVSVVSFNAGGATWLPGKSPANNREFVGITSATSSLTVATITLRGTSAGSGAVSVSGVRLARSGNIVGTGASGTSFTINRALVPAGSPTVTSETHPDQNAHYDSKEIALAWDRPNNAIDFSYVLNQEESTTPETSADTSETSATLTVEHIGTYFFHIRARNADGWGPASHFRINIKASVDETLAVPAITNVRKADSWSMDLEQGTVNGVVFEGEALYGYNLTLTLTPVVPEMTISTVVGKPEPVLEKEDGAPANALTEEQATTNEETSSEEAVEATQVEGTTAEAPLSEEIALVPDGSNKTWQIVSDKPVKAGFYKLSAQGEYNETLTPVSDELRFEISLAKGGSVNIITDEDLNTPEPPKTIVLGIDITKNPLRWTAFLTGITLILAYGVGMLTRRLVLKRLNKPSSKTNKITSPVSNKRVI